MASISLVNLTALPDDIQVYRPYHALFALAMPLKGYRTGSLSLSGALTAAAFGVVTLVLCPSYLFGAMLLSFYFVGSEATKWKAHIKAQFEESPNEQARRQARTSSGISVSDNDKQVATKGKPKKDIHANDDAATALNTDEGKKNKKFKDLSGGNRNAIQVACNGLIGVAACATWIYLFGPTHTWNPHEPIPCPVSPNAGANQVVRTSNALVFAAVGFWAACMGDTLASELGILSRVQPTLITTGKPVPPGTNGGISAWGTLVSLLGGLFIGFIAVFTLSVENNTCLLMPVAEKTGLMSIQSVQMMIILVLVGGAAGLFGSLIDSYLGATLQETLYSQTSNRVIHSEQGTTATDKVTKIGGKKVLSNNAVNAISTTIVAAVCGLLGWSL